MRTLRVNTGDWTIKAGEAMRIVVDPCPECEARKAEVLSSCGRPVIEAVRIAQEAGWFEKSPPYDCEAQEKREQRASFPNTLIGTCPIPQSATEIAARFVCEPSGVVHDVDADAALVERVANAIRGFGTSKTFHCERPYVQDRLRSQARAAIAAMRGE